MKLISYPLISRIIFPKIIKSFPDQKRKLFFTFDDGPHEILTPRILDILDFYDCKASFFCLGKNAEKYPGLIKEIKKRGHVIGNHGFEHISGWKLSIASFEKNVEKAANYIKSVYFRPPYGKLKPAQYSQLKKKYKIIAWNVMSYDFDEEINIEECYNIVVKNAKGGSIIVFHENDKAGEKLLKVLPMLIEHFKQKGCLLSALEC